MLSTLFVSIVFAFVSNRRRPKWTIYFPFINLLFLLLHLPIEGYRAAMFPAYLLLIIFFLINLKRFLKPISVKDSRSSKTSVVLRYVGAIFGLLLYSIAIVAPKNMPVFSLPEPTGNYKIGSQQLAFINNTREEMWTKEAGDFPNISARVWYPAKSVEGYKNAGYIKSNNMVFSYLNYVKTSSYWNAEISDHDKQFPVLIFNHGGGGFNVQNTIQMEELASHGYIVFSLGHAHESAISNYPDGSYISNTWEDMEPQIKEMFQSAKVSKKLRHYNGGDTLTLLEKKEIMRVIHNDFPVELGSIRNWVADTRFFLDELEKMTKNDNRGFYSKLDLDKVGIFGMSFGGATAINLGIHDNRIKAVIDYDGYAYGDTFEDGVKAPIMLISREHAIGRDDVIYLQAEKEAYYVIVNGAYHANFNDSYLWVKYFRPFFIGTLGEINPDKMHSILNLYTVAFFNKFLKNANEEILNVENSIFTEVELKSRNIE